MGMLACVIAFSLSGCGPQKSAETHIQENDSATEEEVIILEEMPADSSAEDYLTWEDIPDDGKPVRFDFEKWLTIMNHIKDNYWSRPTAKMLAGAGLEVLYESDDIDDSGIKAVDFRYGRQVKSITDSAGVKEYTYSGDHAVIFMVDAYTSSGATILFHSPADLKDFIQQAINRGVADLNGEGLIVCDKPMGKGIHKIRKTYEYTETKKGAYKERYYLYTYYNPDDEWQECVVTLDFLRHRLDIEK